MSNTIQKKKTKEPSVKNNPEDQEFDLALRPLGFNEYVGQENIKKNLAILVGAAKKRGDSLDHILVHGPAGLGKTTLALIVAKEYGSGIRITSGAALEKAGDIGSILTGLSDGDFLFIDEVHRLNKTVEETLYPAMENHSLDIIIGKGTSAKTLQIKLPRFTLIAATTKISLLSNPFRSRFGASYKLDFYNQEEMEKIIRRSSDLLGIKTSPEAIYIIARASRYTPRIANRLLRRARDYAQFNESGFLDAEVAKKSLDLLGVDEIGLENTDRRILEVVAKNFKGGPAGLKSIAAAVAEEESTIEDVYEPYLMRIGFLARTPRGRIVTDAGYKHIGLEQPKESQASLL
ncbi:MAG: Holliday junction branch migration DNA helicase RuvB [Candidatus Yanofskybacteria bacterium CG10_big_fil_rev_8_21_14_0_10_36_16]|uniref:Holliday junction branch migration complex subunit RuvB n=1 Tax=Candidatus Yanofskybacteria bacterium CG10_big_fil_rev_8_21_14_0_10_36_16 TaxID=1975096 RepID=A0A2J0Q6F5_9BACT|nr:MAG: Holliday junction branch migration DNA helicase RuvB [Candidatus Yanofskybacteria bacterium CG10_big_fil_rev_8_21_14_0_10_36_16]